MRAIAINGSPRKDGRTAIHLKALGHKIVHLIDGISQAKAEVLAADLIVFATPVYWFNMSSLMKELIDELPEAPDFECEGKSLF